MKKRNVQSFIKVNVILIILLLFAVWGVNEYFIKDIGKTVKIESYALRTANKINVHAGVIRDIKPKKYKATISSNEISVVAQSPQTVVEPVKSTPKVVEPQRKYNFTEEDKTVLARIIQAEAGNQSLKGKCLVGRVVLTRLETGAYKSIKEVVFAKSRGVYQFTPIKDKRYFTVVPTTECYEAIDMLSYGWDESLGAMYFCNGKSTWHNNNLQRLFREGDHVFYK